MITRKYIVEAFADLGKIIDSFIKTGENNEPETAIRLSCEANYWFTKENIYTALSAIADKMLDENKINNWLSQYRFNQSPKKIKLIAAGNIPLVCFHDLLCIMLSGNIAIIKPSSKDKYLIKTLCGILAARFPLLSERIVFDDIESENPDAVIATGSNNSARYFYADYKNIPLLIRKNRYSPAILDGSESVEELEALGEDIFLYYGLGCRNVSNIFVPENYDFGLLLKSMDSRSEVMKHQGYNDCFRYRKANAELSGKNYLSNGFLILRNAPVSYSSIATVNYMEYHDLIEVGNFLTKEKEKIQCIVGHVDIAKIIPFGQSQKPELSDYADGVDTMIFLEKSLKTN